MGGFDFFKIGKIKYIIIFLRVIFELDNEIFPVI